MARTPPTSPPVSPHKIVQEIEQKSKQVRELATLLSKRITAFEAWLDSMPGRVEASAWCPISANHPEDPRAHSFGLHLERASKGWALFYAYTVDDDPYSWKPLSEADLETKMLAVQNFPHLLSQIRQKQDERIRELRASHEALQGLASELGLPLDGEGA